MITAYRSALLGAAIVAASASSAVTANDFREQGKTVKVAKSAINVTPPKNWNKLSATPAKHAEVWTLDGEQLNEVTFYGGVIAGKPLVKERNKKRNPLPKFTSTTLLIELPELLENTYRASKQIGSFSLTSSKPDRFLDRDGIYFAYEFLDQDNLPRKGEARAVLINKKLYLVTFEAPRVHYFDRTIDDFRALASTATVPS